MSWRAAGERTIPWPAFSLATPMRGCQFFAGLGDERRQIIDRAELYASLRSIAAKLSWAVEQSHFSLAWSSASRCSSSRRPSRTTSLA